MINNSRGRNWCLILYPIEDETHYKALEYIKKNYSDFAYIEHDLDLDNNGQLKKSHTHVVIHFNNARFRNSIALELGITPNYVQSCNNINLALEYLIHLNDPDKYQYSIDKVIGSLKNKLILLIENKNISESEKVQLIIDFLKSYDKTLSYTDFIEFIISNNFYSTFRRSATMFSKILDEHNFKISKYYKN